MNGESTEDLIRSSFARMKLDIDAFSSLRYIGIQTQIPPTSFSELRDAVTQELNNTTVRSARSPQIVFVTLNVSTFFYLLFPWYCEFEIQGFQHSGKPRRSRHLQRPREVRDFSSTVRP